MGYRDFTFREEFPDLFDGAFVEIRNPALMSMGEVRTIQAELGDEASDEDRGRLVLARLILAWNLPPVDDPDAGPLPVPPSPQDLERIPSPVYLWLLGKASPSPNGEAPGGKASGPRSRGKRR